MPFFLLVIFLSCAQTEKKEKTYFDSFNRDYVKVPIAEEKDKPANHLVGTKGRETNIRGKCIFDIEGQEVVLRGKKFKLFNKTGELVIMGSTGHDGTFHITENIDDGDYYLILYNDNIKLRKKFSVKGFDVRLGEVKLQRIVPLEPVKLAK